MTLQNLTSVFLPTGCLHGKMSINGYLPEL